MKKINKRSLFFLLFMVLMVVLTSSCSKHTLQESITINDPYGLLHKDLKDSLANQNPILPTRIEVVKELPFGSEVAILDSLWNVAPTDVLIVASLRPSYVFVRLDEQYESVMSSALEGALGSTEYYEMQMSDQLDLNNKIIVVINQLLNSESSIANAVIIEFIKGEILGPLYSWTSPDDSWVYRYLYYPAQRPFVWMINLTGNYFIGMLLTWAILFGLMLLLVRMAVRSYIKRHRNKTREQLGLIGQGIGTIIGLLVLTIPMIFGCLSIAIQLSNTGVEFSRGLVECMGLSYNFVDSFYQSEASKPNILLTIIAVLCIYLGKYDKENGGLSAAAYAAAALIILLASSAAFAWAVILFILEATIFNSKVFYEDTYMKLRIAGNSKFTSLMHTLLYLVVVVGASFLGRWTGLRNVEIKHDRFHVPACKVVNADIDKPRPHVENWFCQFDEELAKILDK